MSDKVLMRRFSGPACLCFLFMLVAPGFAFAQTAEELLAPLKEQWPQQVWEARVEQLQQHMKQGKHVPRFLMRQYEKQQRTKAERALLSQHPWDQDSTLTPVRRPANVPLLASEHLHTVPFATQNTPLEISLTNAQPGDLPNVRLRAQAVPSWLTLPQTEVSFPLLEQGQAVVASFAVSVQEDAPVGEVIPLLFEVWVNGQLQLMKEVKLHIAAPKEVHLLGNYPNPFNPVTTISYILPKETRVVLQVYDMLGRKVAVLVDGLQGPGKHRLSFDASHLASGMYLYRLEAGDRLLAGKMLLLK